MSHRVGGVKEGDKGGEDEGQKTEPVEIKGDDEGEKRHGAHKCFNELNEVIRSQDLILQDLGAVGMSGVTDGEPTVTQTTKKTQDRMFIVREPFNNAAHNVQVRRPLGKQTGSARDGQGDVGMERERES